MMADGVCVLWYIEMFMLFNLTALVVFQAFSVKQQENLQEILSAQIILSQCLIALAIVRPGILFHIDF